MGLISREASAPITDGETASAADVENEFDKLFSEFNGNIDDDNVKAGAGINGSKLASGTVSTTQLTDDTITTTDMAASAVPKANVETDTGQENPTTSATFVDVPGITGLTVTPGSASDFLFIDFTCTMQANASGSLYYAFAFEVDSVDTVDLAVLEIGESSNDTQSVHVSYAVAAGGTSAITIKPRYREVRGSAGVVPEFGNNVSGTISKVLRVMVIPIK